MASQVFNLFSAFGTKRGAAGSADKEINIAKVAGRSIRGSAGIAAQGNKAYLAGRAKGGSVGTAVQGTMGGKADRAKGGLAGNVDEGVIEAEASETRNNGCPVDNRD